MNTTYMLVTGLFVIVSFAMILVILVQRPQGGGLAGAFGGSGVGGTDSVFGGRVGDALTTTTVVAFAIYLLVAITLNLLPTRSVPSTEQAGANVGSPMPPTGPAQGTGDAGFPSLPGLPVEVDPSQVPDEIRRAAEQGTPAGADAP